MESFSQVIFVLLIISMVATLGVLFVGVYSMGRSGKIFSPRFSNKLMRLRVISQAITIALLALFLLTKAG